MRDVGQGRLNFSRPIRENRKHWLAGRIFYNFRHFEHSIVSTKKSAVEVQLRCPDSPTGRPEIARAKTALSKHAMDDDPPDRQGGKSSRAELGGSGLTPVKATRARSAEEDPDVKR